MVTGDSERRWSVVVTWRDKPEHTISCINLDTAQCALALSSINQLFDRLEVNAGDRIRLYVLEESDVVH